MNYRPLLTLSCSLILFFPCFSYAQGKKPDQSFQYCYCPKDNSENNTAVRGDLRFRVSKFIETNITQLELEVTRQDGAPLKGFRMVLTANMPYPNGRIVPNDPTMEAYKITFKFISRLFMENEQFVVLYANMFSQDKFITSSGFITIYRSTSTNTDFQAECQKRCPEQSSSQTNEFDFRPPKAIATSASGKKEVVLEQTLIEQRILPTNGMIRLLYELNPGLVEEVDLPVGKTLQLPNFPVPDATRQASLQAQFNSDRNIDKEGTLIFKERSKFLSALLPKLEIPNDSVRLKKSISDIIGLMEKLATNPNLFLRKMQTQLLNSEVSNFTNFILNPEAAGYDHEANANYIHQFRDYLFEVIGKEDNTGINKSKSRSGSGPNIDYTNSDIEMEMENDMWAPNTLNIYIYAFRDKDTPPLDNYIIFCISGFQYDVLKAKKKRLVLSDFQKVAERCRDMASTASRSIYPSFPYYIIAVSKDSEDVVMCSSLNLSKDNTFATGKYIDKPHAIALYIFDKCGL